MYSPLKAIEQAQQCLAQNRLSPCFELIDELLELEDTPAFRILKRDMIQTKAVFHQLEKDTILKVQTSEKLDLRRRQLIQQLLALLDLVEAEIKHLKTDKGKKQLQEDKHRVEIKMMRDFGAMTEEEIAQLLNRLASIIRTNPDELVFIATRPGSTIIEIEVSLEVMVKLVELQKENTPQNSLRIPKIIHIIPIDNLWTSYLTNRNEIIKDFSELNNISFLAKIIKKLSFFGKKNFTKSSKIKPNNQPILGSYVFENKLRTDNLLHVVLPQTNLSNQTLLFIYLYRFQYHG